MKQRIKSCSRLLKKLGYDSLLISDPTNISYLTGTQQACGYLLITSDENLIYFTNFLYKKVSQKIKIWKLVISDFGYSVFDLLTDEVKKLKHKKVAFEAKNLPFLEYKTIHKNFSKNNISFKGTNDLVAGLRMIKQEKEISLIRKAIRTGKETFEFITEIFGEEMTECDLGLEIEKFLRLKGDDEVAFKPIVASGKNTVFPHHLPQKTKIGKEFFLIDLGSRHCGYCSDLTRMFFWGKMPLLFKKIYDTVLKAQELAIGEIKDGVIISRIDKAARGFIEKKGWGKYFGHGLGHGIGLSVHEPPFIAPDNDNILKEGMVITIEPAIYFKDKFGIRIEDMVLVKKNKGEVLSGDAHR